MIKFSYFFCLIFLASPAFSLSENQRTEMQKTIKNMQSILPRRIDAITTVTSTWMTGNTWYLNTQIDTGGRSINEAIKTSLRNYIKDQYCRPPYKYLDAGLIITNQYYDKNNNYLFAASASKSICGR